MGYADYLNRPYREPKANEEEKMKKFQLSMIVCVLICSIFWIITATPALSKTTVLRWSHPSPQRGLEPELMAWISNEIEKRTDGRVKIQVFWGGSLANFQEMAEATRSGLADVGWISGAYHQGYGELVGVAHATTVLNPDSDPVEYTKKWYRMLDAIPDFYEDFTNNNNMMPISIIYYDEYQIFSNKAVRKLEDMKGLIIRAISEGRQVAFKAVGASPVFIGAGEMYSALEKGTIDAVEYSPDTSRRYNIHQITKYFTDIKLQPGVAYWCINLDKFKQLSQPDQKVLLDVGREAAFKKAEWMAEERSRSLQAFKEEGMEILQFPEADRQKFANTPEYRAYTQKWVAEKEAKGLPARKAVDVFCDIFDIDNPLN